MRLLAQKLSALIAILSIETECFCETQPVLTPPELNAWQTTRTNPAFFPIAVWMQAPSNAAAYRDAGINLYVGLWAGPTDVQLTELHRTGMLVICSLNQLALTHPTRSNIFAWMHDDEPDNARTRGARLGLASPMPPDSLLADHRRILANDSTRPVFLNLGQGVAWDNWYGRGTRNRRPEDYPDYLLGCDIASFDIYPTTHPDLEVRGNLWYVPRGVERLRAWVRDEKPVWNCIETTHCDDPKRKPTPHEVRAQVWMSLIHGSRGIIYFAHQFEPTFIEAALLADKEMLAAVKRMNQQITSLAPALNSSSVTDLVSVASSNPAAPIATMVKEHGGDIFIFAVAMRPLKSEVRFSIKRLSENTTVEVIGENRELHLDSGTFSDSFGEWDVHLYRVRRQP